MPPTLSPYTVAREILRENVDLPTDEVVAKAKARGVNVPDAKLRHAIHNTRAELKKQGPKNGKPAAPAAPAAAKAAAKGKGKAKPKAAPAAPAKAAPPAPSTAPPTPDLTSVLTNVTLVNRTLDLCGGADNARKAAEAVRACGGVELFLMHVDIVAAIRTPSAP